MADIKIPDWLFLDLYKYHILDLRNPDREARIRAALTQKGDAIARRAAFSKAHKSPPEG